MNFTVLNLSDLRRYRTYHEFEGYLYNNTSVSFILVEEPSGSGPRLHSHPYEEVFIVQEGQATFTVGLTTIEVTAGQIVIVPAGLPHKFVNSGAETLRQVDIHVSKHFITTWLED